MFRHERKQKEKETKVWDIIYQSRKTKPSQVAKVNKHPSHPDTFD